MPKVSAVVRVPEARRVSATAATGEPERSRQAPSQPAPMPPARPETPAARSSGPTPEAPRLSSSRARTKRTRPAAAARRRTPTAVARATDDRRHHQKSFRESRRIVTGPWFTSATSIVARKTPVATGRPDGRSRDTKCS